MRWSRFIVWIRWAIAALLMAGTSSVISHAPIPEPLIVRGERCVEPTDVMRRDHMDMLMHQRDDTVIGGIRSSKHSLLGCIDCHAERDTHGKFIRIDAPGQFCSTCHEYVAVKMDCFGCHAAVPLPQENASVRVWWRERKIVTQDKYYPWLASMSAIGAGNE